MNTFWRLSIFEKIYKDRLDVTHKGVVMFFFSIILYSMLGYWTLGPINRKKNVYAVLMESAY